MATCRFCGKFERDRSRVVKYSVRHYAHHECYLKAGKPLADLHDWKVAAFPYRLIKQFGLTEYAEAAAAREARHD